MNNIYNIINWMSYSNCYENTGIDSNVSLDPSNGNSFVPGVGERHIRPKGPAPNLDYADLAVFFGDH